MKKTTLVEVIIMLYAILYLYTGSSILMDYEMFRLVIDISPLLVPVVKPIMPGLPWIQFIIVFLLIIPRWRLTGLYTALALMILFTAYSIGILLIDDKLPCGCGGLLQQLSWPQRLIFNIIYITLALLGILLEKQLKRKDKYEWTTVAGNPQI